MVSSQSLGFNSILISHLILLALPLPPFVGEENLRGGVSAGDSGGELADIEYELNEGDSDNWRKKGVFKQ